MITDFGIPLRWGAFRVPFVISVTVIALTLGLTACEGRTIQEIAQAALGSPDPALCPEGNPDAPLPPHCIAYPKPGTIYPDKMPLLEGLAWPQAQEDLIGALGKPLTQQTDKLTYRYGDHKLIFPCDWQGCHKWEVK